MKTRELREILQALGVMSWLRDLGISQAQRARRAGRAEIEGYWTALAVTSPVVGALNALSSKSNQSDWARLAMLVASVGLGIDALARLEGQSVREYLLSQGLRS